MSKLLLFVNTVQLQFVRNAHAHNYTRSNTLTRYITT